MSLRKRGMLECRRLMSELMWGERGGMLRLKCERILVLEVMVSSKRMRIKAMEMCRGRGLTSMHAAFGCWE